MHHRVGTGIGPSGEHADRTGDVVCAASFQNAGPRPPETLKTQKPWPGTFHLHKCSCVWGKRTRRCSPAGCIQRQRLGHAFRVSPVMVTVCHGPLGWGQRSSLSSFRNTLAERFRDDFLVCSHYSPIRVYLSSPSALPSLPHTHPRVTGPIPARGINGLLKEYHWGNKTYCLSRLILQLPFRCHPPSAWVQSICMTIVTEKSISVCKFPACLEVFTHVREALK